MPWGRGCQRPPFGKFGWPFREWRKSVYRDPCSLPCFSAAFGRPRPTRAERCLVQPLCPVVEGELYAEGKTSSHGLKLQTQFCGFGFSYKNQKKNALYFCGHSEAIGFQYKMTIWGGRVKEQTPSMRLVDEPSIMVVPFRWTGAHLWLCPFRVGRALSSALLV